MRPPSDLREWAAAYREARCPPDDLARRIRRAARQDTPVPVAGGRQRWGLGLAIGTLVGLAAVLLLSWGVRAIRGVATHRAAPMEAPHGSVSAPDESVDHPAKAPSRARLSGAEPSAVQSPAPISNDEPAQAQPPTARPSSRPVSVVGGSTAGSDLDSQADTSASASTRDLESMRKLRRAERLIVSDPAAALRQLEDHVREYPRTVVELEREALWLRAACALGGVEGITARREAFAGRPGAQAYAPSVRRACDPPPERP